MDLSRRFGDLALVVHSLARPHEIKESITLIHIPVHLISHPIDVPNDARDVSVGKGNSARIQMWVFRSSYRDATYKVLGSKLKLVTETIRPKYY